MTPIQLVICDIHVTDHLQLRENESGRQDGVSNLSKLDGSQLPSISKRKAQQTYSNHPIRCLPCAYHHSTQALAFNKLFGAYASREMERSGLRLGDTRKTAPPYFSRWSARMQNSIAILHASCITSWAWCRY